MLVKLFIEEHHYYPLGMVRLFLNLYSITLKVYLIWRKIYILWTLIFFVIGDG